MNKKNKDQIIGLFGENIEHSLSPDIHNYLANVMGLKYHYFLFDVKPNDLKKAIEALRLLNIRGVNITIPHKKATIKYLDEVDEQVKKIGAVNTVLNENERLIGFNTDVAGFDEMAYNKGITFNEQKIVLLGAGGVARAVIYYLKDKEIKDISIINRTVNRAFDVKDDFSTELDNIKIIKKDSTKAEEVINNSDIIINATPLGTENIYEDKSPVTKKLLNEDQILIDLVYQPRVTKFLQFGKDKGAKIVSGIEMLVYQAVKSFEIWTDSRVDYHVVNELINNL